MQVPEDTLSKPLAGVRLMDLTPRLTVKQTAVILGHHPDTVRDLCNRGLLASTRTDGGHRRISMQAIESYVSRCNAEPNKAA
jgi:excisionase family DNA binding protein